MLPLLQLVTWEINIMVAKFRLGTIYIGSDHIVERKVYMV